MSFKTDFSSMAFATWLATARNALRSGDPGICVGACERCATAVVLDPNQRAQLACPHCRDVREGPMHTLVTDQWFEPWAHVESQTTTIEYRLACVTEPELSERDACGTCGIALGKERRCPRCGTLAVIARADAPTFRVMVRASGTRGDQTFSALLPIAEAEVRFSREARATGALRSSRSFNLAIAIGASILLAMFLLCALLLAWCLH